MPRTRFLDPLQAHPFWLMDTSPVGLGALPLLNPLSGFSSITAPEITLDVEEIAEGNWMFKRKVVKSAGVSALSLSRGATFYESDFFRWVVFALTGKAGVLTGASPRRNLLLVHFFSHVTVPGVGAALGAVGLGIGAFEIFKRVPARAWMLSGCIPSRYKAGADFDAASGEVSLMELDLECEMVEEYALGSNGLLF